MSFDFPKWIFKADHDKSFFQSESLPFTCYSSSSSAPFCFLYMPKRTSLIYLVPHIPQRQRLPAHNLHIFRHKSPLFNCGSSDSSCPVFTCINLPIMLQRPHLYHLRRHVRSGSVVEYFRVASHRHENHSVVLKLPHPCFLDLSEINRSPTLALWLETYLAVALAHPGV